jgi:hypothetical protein
MLSDVHQFSHSAREYTIVSRVISDILKKIVDLILVVSSRFRIGRRLSGKRTPGSGSSCRRFVDLADRCTEEEEFLSWPVESRVEVFVSRHKPMTASTRFGVCQHRSLQLR